MILLLQALVLGAVQGLSEFGPVSSSAHLIIVPWLFGWNDPFINSIGFDVALHLGTLLAVLAYFWADWIHYVRAWFRSVLQRPLPAIEEAAVLEQTQRRLAWLLIIGTVPGAIAGLFLEGTIDDRFHQPSNLKPGLLIIAATLSLMGLVLFAAERYAKHSRPLSNLNWRDSLLIGLSQAAAVIPGVSRSGSTLSAGMALGLKRDDAARFSFLLGAPIIAGAGAKKLFDLATAGISSEQVLLVLTGFVSAAVFGFLCIRVLLAYLRLGKTYIFVGYRLAIALLVVILVFWRG